MANKRFNKSILPAFAGSIVFLSVLLLTQYLSYQEYLISKEIEHQKLLQQASIAKEKFQRILSNSIDAANSLAIMCAEYGFPKDFNTVGRRILGIGKYVDAVGLVKGGVLTDVYPLKKNKGLIGANKSSNPLLFQELKAVANEGVYFAGPRKLTQGGYGILGQEPVIVGGKLMGYVLVRTKFEIIQKELGTNGRKDEFSYVLYRNSNHNTQQNFSLNDVRPNNKSRTISVDIPQGNWKLKVAYSDNHQVSAFPYKFSFLGLILSFVSGLYIYRKANERKTLYRIVDEKTVMLNERVKELSAIYKINTLLLNEEQTIDEMFVKTAELIKSGWQYPEICEVKIVFEGKDYSTKKYKESNLKQLAELNLADGRKGVIEVAYVEEHPISRDISFLPEEYDLLISIASILEVYLNKITQREKLELSEEQFRRAFEQAVIGKAIVALDGSWIQVNRALCDMLGYTEEEFLNFNYRQMTYPEDLESNVEIHDQFLNTEQKSYKFEKRYVHKNGSVVWVNVNVVVIRDDANKPLYVVAQIENITDKKNFYVDLQKSEANMRSIFDSSVVGFVLIDADLKIVSFNEHFKKYCIERTGEEPLIGKYDIEQISIIKTPVFSELFTTTLTEDRTVEYEEEYLGEGDLPKYYHYTITPVKNNDKIIGLCIAVNDISEQKRLELERIEIIDNLTNRNRDLEQFSYIVSHNIRMPLSNLLGLITLLENDISEEDKIFINEAIKESVLKLDDVVADVNHILSIRKKQHVTKENVDMDKEIQKIQAEFKDIIHNTNTKITYDFSAVNSINSIPTYIHSIFLNLISNSFKFTAKGVSPEIKIWSQKEEGFVKIYIQDNGSGIDLEKNGKKMFGLYRRFDLSQEGKGMGLFMVKNQVEALKGTIAVESELGKGSTFIIRLPLN